MRILQRFAACMPITRDEKVGVPMLMEGVLRKQPLAILGARARSGLFGVGLWEGAVRQVEIVFRCLTEPVTELRVIGDKLCAKLFAAAFIERLARKIYGAGRVTGYSVVID